MFVCYVAIYRFVNNSHTALQRFYSEDKEQTCSTGGKILNIHRKEDLQLAITLFLTFITYLVMWSPYMTAAVVDFENSWPKHVYVIAIAMGHSNSFLNSIIYGVSNPIFRQGYSVFLHKILCCKTKPELAKCVKKNGNTCSVFAT